MTARIDFARATPRALQAMLDLQNYVNHSGLDHRLLALVKMRASQINGCGYCIDMHTKDALVEGETAQRLFLLDAWREAPFYDARERAALEWTEALTVIHEDRVPDSVYASVREHFSDQELGNLSLAIVAINGWNRLMIGFRREVGTYRVPARTEAKAG